MEAVLNQWTALLLVAQYQDPNALPALYQELCEWFSEKGEVYPDDLEIFFEDFFNNVRSVLVEDDSMKEVGTVLHGMYCRCCRDDYSMVQQYMQSVEIYRQQNPLALCVNGGTGEDYEDDTDGNLPVEGDAVEEEGSYNGAITEEYAPVQQQQHQQQQQQQQQPKPKNNKKKNAYSKTNGGWNTVL
ncbi:pre-rRNA-processing protein TSR2 [Strigomonas culicis]|uniref:Pre-rRNA-processing protein TSR2 n=1 Tax=Strigomonas culicis TaxID=28005 RepID=S9U0J0_9TRYP|nr:pre-rRNA-processing protein TSR2 [Strigomonas culicis]|eukprot:EPY24272.1 pre-rRNA-processing protein TSR2 [Strigomonas culicis]